MLHMPTPMLMAQSGRTYEDWVAHVITRTTGGAKTWPNDTFGSGQGLFRTTADNGSLSSSGMDSTPWGAGGGVFSRTSRIARIVQHALPSEAEFNAQRAAGRVILLQIVTESGAIFGNAYARNGYTSGDYFDEPYGKNCTLAAWWDGATGIPMMSNPAASGAPSPYTATGWSL